MLKVEDIIQKTYARVPTDPGVVRHPDPVIIALAEVLVEAINQEVEAAIKRMARR